MNVTLALANLLKGYDALARAGARPFLVDGTLLGAVREGSLMAHDKDVDLGVFIESWRPECVTAMQRAGFEHRRTFGSAERGLELSFRRRDLKLDVFMYYLDGDVRYHAAWPKGQAPIRYDYQAFDLAPIALAGREFMAPADPEAFLVAKYGEDWRVPVAEWDWRWGPKNARPWPAEVA